MKVGFIGLGHLGSVMVGRLKAEGVEPVVWNRTRAKAEALGLPVAENPAALIGGADIVILSLFDSDAVESVLTSPDGLLAGDCAGKIVVDTSTNHFERVAAFHGIVREHGASYLEAPVLGSVVPASQGALTVLVSGDADACERARPILEVLAKTLFYLGEPGRATRMKLINNLVLGTLMATSAEAVALGEAAGIDRETAVDILLAGAGNSAVLAGKREKLVSEDFSTHFSSALIYKDLHYLQDLARDLRRPLFTGSITKELYGLVRMRGIDDLDFSALYTVLRDY
ncbi:6-phosphogluconate dehydrogenase [Methanoculleus taiwanensis]|uniref:6-phosphogluconate dehydrogenase n=2 Tax=Methanoculleus taiwanensis TaxID=1550565 RepID=A0A498H5Q2_9EURY|nr:6-phosphogluconate dehydrogenase [Methanoculleus taiwanensis]